MKLAFFTDLHLDHWYRIQVNQELSTLADRCKEADVVLNGGDTSEANIRYDIKAWFPNQEYLEIPGNHDYYKGTFKNKFYTKEIGGYRFFCGTLWTNFNENPLAETVAQRSINDFRYIDGATVEAMKKAYYETKAALEEYRPQIVMTHFAPFHQSISPKFTGDLLNFFFCNNMKQTLLDQQQIRLWLHGHTHVQMDYQLDGRRVVNHSLGYPGEITFKFNDYYPKIIEI